MIPDLFVKVYLASRAEVCGGLLEVAEEALGPAAELVRRRVVRVQLDSSGTNKGVFLLFNSFLILFVWSLFIIVYDLFVFNFVQEGRKMCLFL